MNPKLLTDGLMVSGQINLADIDQAAAAGVRAIINNRPDGEEPNQPLSAALEAHARAAGLDYHHIPVSGGRFDDASIRAFDKARADADGDVLAFCRTGTRSTTLWALSQAGRQPADTLLRAAQAAGYDLSAHRARLDAASDAPDGTVMTSHFDVVVVGGGAGGIATAASILKRNPR